MDDFIYSNATVSTLINLRYVVKIELHDCQIIAFISNGDKIIVGDYETNSSARDAFDKIQAKLVRSAEIEIEDSLWF